MSPPAELLHVREKHFRCHLCERRGVEAERLYYGTYPQMEAHFRESHFLCEHPDCKDRQLENVFMTEFDLQVGSRDFMGQSNPRFHHH